MADSPDSSAAACWVPAGANPFGVDIVDCRPITHDVVAFTSDQEIADSFLRLRESDGREHVPLEAAQALTTDCYLVYPPATGADDGPLFKAAQMEDKWDIYLYRPYLYSARSWTGSLIYRALTHFADDSSSIVKIAYDQRVNETPNSRSALSTFFSRATSSASLSQARYRPEHRATPRTSRSTRSRRTAEIQL